MTNLELVEIAIKAKQNAYVPYSNFKVGAALLGKSGKVYSGCNVECSSYGISLCAERTALVKAISEGEREFEKIAVVGGLNDELTYTTPCGACRQFLSDFGNLEIILGYKEDKKDKNNKENNDNKKNKENNELKIKTFRIKDLLPESFSI